MRKLEYVECFTAFLAAADFVGCGIVFGIVLAHWQIKE